MKILQRVYKYGGQPFVRDYLAKNHGDSFDRSFGKGNGKAMMHATAGRYYITYGMTGYNVVDIVQLNRNWRDRSPSARRFEDQKTNKSGSVPRTGRFQNHRGRGVWTLSRMGLDSCAQCSRILRRKPIPHMKNHRSKINLSTSFSVDLQRLKSTSTSSPTTTRRAGCKISWHQLQVLVLPSSCPRRSM